MLHNLSLWLCMHGDGMASLFAVAAKSCSRKVERKRRGVRAVTHSTLGVVSVKCPVGLHMA